MFYFYHPDTDLTRLSAAVGVVVSVRRFPYRTYSFLVSSETGILLPLGLSSCWMISPYALCSTQKVWSRTPVMSLSLRRRKRRREAEFRETKKQL